MKVRNGIAVSPGVAEGPVLVLGSEDFRIPNRFVSQDAVEAELLRLRTSLDVVCKEIEAQEQSVSEQVGERYGAIFAAHLQMARDPKLLAEIETHIREQHFSPEFAVSRVLRHYASALQNLGNSYLAERSLDIYDLEKRLLRQLLGESREELTNLTTPVIILANDLTPGETATLNPEFVLGFATEGGGRTSHTAILAGALELPAVVGLGRFLREVSGGETCILDGDHGQVIIDPDEKTQQRYRRSRDRILRVSQRLAHLDTESAVTADGERILLMGNIEFPEEAALCKKRGADGIGLYRTEFLYLGTVAVPTEEDQYNAYRQVLDLVGDKPVVIRTLDFGADKIPGMFEQEFADSPNPMLGLRSIRLCLQHTELFRVQLRALLRAAAHGDVRIMFPLIASLLELRQAKMVMADVMEDLDEQGIEFRRDVPVGMMVEVPSAAILAREFAREVDFFSIGTNDLIQYTLACDRSDPAVASLYRSGDPAILRLIKSVVDAADEQNRPVTVCGQMSSEPRFVAPLVGMGLRSLSVTPSAIPRLKEVIRNLTIPAATQIAIDVLQLELARDVENHLLGELGNLCPDFVL